MKNGVLSHKKLRELFLINLTVVDASYRRLLVPSYFVVLELAPLKVKTYLRHSHNTRFWYLLGMFRNFSTSNPVTFFSGEPRVLNHNYF